MGIDRLDFPNVAFYRDDFASESLGVLMNALGAEPMGVLIPKDLADEKKLTQRRPNQRFHCHSGSSL